MVEKSEEQKPSLEAVIEYARKHLDYVIGRKASGFPRELQEEMRQNAYLRVCEAYPNLDPNKGWMAFVQDQCKGVLDYIRDGTGFEESRASLNKDEEDPEKGEEASNEEGTNAEPTGEAPAQPEEQRRRAPPARHRVSNHSKDTDEAMDVESVLGLLGVAADSESEEVVFRPNWPLIARMASIDQNIHLIAKILLGFTQEDLAPSFEVTRERLSQRIREFFDALDAPENVGSMWTEQTIFAFGIWDLFWMDPKDNGMGWDLNPIDLFWLSSAELMSGRQQKLFPAGATVAGPARIAIKRKVESLKDEKLKPEQHKLSLFGA